MRIAFTFARNGHKAEIKSFLENRSDLTPQEAMPLFVAQKWGIWIEKNLTERFKIENVTDTGFEVQFEVLADGVAFLESVGGRVLEQ